MIELNNFSFAYRNNKVFEGINLQFERGAIYGLLGENGVGKTTLLKAISGLLRPGDGSCIVDGRASFDRQPGFLSSIFFLPDDMPLPDNATPITFFRLRAPFYPNQDEQRLWHLASEFNIDVNRRFAQMSFGQQKKSLLACSLALRTDYLLLDEPTNGLDIPSKADFRRIMTECVDEHQTVIVSTHQVKDVENLIDPIIIISNNSVMLNASVEEITKRLYFDYSSEQRVGALYSEMIPGGWINVVENDGRGESRIDIEALFNAVLRNADRVKNLF